MAEWKRYQDETADLFRELGCSVDTDAKIAGARGTHLIDVSVKFSKFGLHQHWIVECKFWNRAVPKEKVLAFKSIIDDIGANRGILVSERGHQAGALASARNTNVTLTSLKELRAAARGELLSLGLSEVQRRAAEIKNFIFSLWVTERHESGFYESTIRPDVDGPLATKIGGIVSILGTGVEQAQLGAFPVPLSFTDDGNRIIRAKDLEEFVVRASGILDNLAESLSKLKLQAAMSE